MKRFFYILLPLIALTFTTHVAAQGVTSVGTEFVFSFPTNYEDPGASAQYVRLYIAAATSTTVRIYVGRTLKKTLSADSGSISTYDLTKFEAQALSRDTRSDVPPDAIYANKAVRVVADDPISLTGMNRTSYTSDGMLILPVSALGSQYVVASARDYLTGGAFPDKLPSQFLVAAAFDETTVTITTPSETPNHAAGETYTITLDKGDVFSSMSFGPGGDLSGAVIEATKPVAVMAGQNCAYLPDQRYPACDHLAEMMLPVESWGTVYHAVPFATRLKGDLFRIFAAEPDTEVYINGRLVFLLTQRGGAEGTGWAEFLPPQRENLEFTSNKPIMVAQYNNSQNYDGVISDPFYLVLTPVDQYQTRTIIATPKAGDFAQNYMTIVSDSAGWTSIEIATTGTESWENLSQKIQRPVRSFTSLVNGRRHVGVTFDIAAGAYKLRGLQPFAGYLYGFGNFDSYGYPMSVSTGWLGSADEKEPDIAAALGAGGRVTGTATDGPDDDAVRSNLALVELRSDLGSNYRLVVGTFDAGISRSAGFELVPIDSTQPARAVVMAVDKAGNVAYDTVVYDGPASVPIVIATGHDFAEVVLTGEPPTAEIEVRNVGDVSVILVGVQSLSGDAAAFILPDASVYTNVTLAPGSIVAIPVTFRPTEVRNYSLDIVWTFDPALGAVTSSLRGTGILINAAPAEGTSASVAIESISPNPGGDGPTTIRYRSNGRAASFTLTRADGTPMRAWSEPAGAVATRIDLGGLAPGAYLVRLAADGATSVRTLVVVW